MNIQRIVIAAAASFATGHIFAAGDSPVISSVQADRQLETLVIKGAHLSGPTPIRLYLRGYATALETLDASDSVIRARLPRNIQPGSYMLTVSAHEPQQVKLLLRTPDPRNRSMAGQVKSR